MPANESERSKKRDLIAIAKGWLLAIPLLFLCSASYVTGKLVGRNKTVMKWLSAAGLASGAAVMLAVAWIVPSSVFGWLSLLSVAGAGFGIALPVMDTLLTEGIAKKQRGAVTSLYSSMRFIGVAAGPPATALLAKGGHGAVFYSYASLCAAAMCITLIWIRPGNSQGPISGLGDHLEITFEISNKLPSKSRT
jgi:ACDE family multidrug resistance protein